MKIIQINASYKPAYIYGGPALSVSRLCESLAKAGADVEVLTTTANGEEELPVKINEQQVVDGVKVTYYKRLTKDHTHFSPALLLDFKRKLTSKGKAENIIVHIHVWWNLVSIFTCFIARYKKIAVVLTPRGTLSNYTFGNRNQGIKDYIHRFLGKSLLEYCHFHVTSEKEKEDLLKLLGPKSVTVIPNFVYLPGLDETEKQYGTGESITGITDPIKLLFLSRIEEKKGLDILFQALAEVQVAYHLTIAGTGDKNYLSYLQDLAVSLNISTHITWAGQIDQGEKWSVMQDHDLMILPSHDENFANVVIECLSTGTPVIVSNMVGLSDYVKRNDFGWICSVDKGSLKQKLLQAASETEKAKRIREIAPEQIRADFNEDVLVQDFLNLYNKVLKDETPHR